MPPFGSDRMQQEWANLAVRYDGKAPFLSESQVDQYKSKVTMKDDKLTDNLSDEHCARHLSDLDSF